MCVCITHGQRGKNTPNVLSCVAPCPVNRLTGHLTRNSVGVHTRAHNLVCVRIALLSWFQAQPITLRTSQKSDNLYLNDHESRA